MFNISGYLEKFKKLGDKKDKIRQAIADSLKEETGISINPATVKVSRGEVSVSAPQTAHAIIFMKRERVLQSLKRRIPDVFIDRIRCY